MRTKYGWIVILLAIAVLVTVFIYPPLASVSEHYDNITLIEFLSQVSVTEFVVFAIILSLLTSRFK